MAMNPGPDFPPGPGPAPSGPNREVVAPIVGGAALVALVVFIGSLTFWAETSTSDLCSAYSKASAKVSDDSTYVVDLDGLASAASHYPKSEVQDAGKALDKMTGTFSVSAYYRNAAPIAAECSGAY